MNTTQSTTSHAYTSFHERGLWRVWVQRASAAPRLQPVFEPREEFARIMEEPPGGENHGYLVNGSRKSLNWQDWIKEEFLSTPGWGSERPHSDRPPGRPKTIDAELLTPKAIAAVERRLGFSVEEFQRVTRRGRLRGEDRQLRSEIADKLAEVVHEGSVVSGLADVLGRDERTIWRLVASQQGSKCRTNSLKGEDSGASVTPA